MKAVLNVNPLKNLLMAAPWTEATYPFSNHTFYKRRRRTVPHEIASAYQDSWEFYRSMKPFLIA